MDEDQIVVSTQLRIERGLLSRLDSYIEKQNERRRADGYKALSRNAVIIEAVRNLLDRRDGSA